MIDLHSHSTMSDGTDPPRRVVELAAEAQLSALALTDHDTLDHLPAARAAADGVGVRLVAGCEISCELGNRAPGSMHLLVFFVDDASGELQDRLRELQAARNARNVQIVEALNAHGVPITLDAVRAQAGPGSVGRPHIARVLMEEGYVSSIQEAFDVWLAKGRPAYFERDRLTPEDAIELTHASSGVCAIAHPLSLGLADDALDEFVGDLAAARLDALECEYGAYDPELRAPLNELAARHGLAPTGGSDYHGENKPGLSVGTGRGDLHVPDEYLDELESRRP
ncbi:MAG TPA: PHP domain-containing protein [Acidimicrobiia bacterium]